MSPGERLLQGRCRWAGGLCAPEGTPTSGLSGTQATVLCCAVPAVEGVSQTMGHTSVWELFLVTASV